MIKSDRIRFGPITRASDKEGLPITRSAPKNPQKFHPDKNTQKYVGKCNFAEWFGQEYVNLATISNGFHTYRNEIYDIGTGIRTRSRSFTKIIESFYKSIIPQEIKSAGHSPSSGSVKTRFKAIFKKLPSWIRRCCLHGCLPPEGD